MRLVFYYFDQKSKPAFACDSNIIPRVGESINVDPNFSGVVYSVVYKYGTYNERGLGDTVKLDEVYIVYK